MQTREQYVSMIIKNLVSDHIQSVEMWDSVLADEDIGNDQAKMRIKKAMWDVESHLQDEFVKSTIDWEEN